MTENKMTENKIELMSKRHSVRNYSDQVISDEMIEKMQIMIKECNQKSGLSIQLIQNEPKAFDSFMAHYGKFQGVSNYIALIGKKGKDMEEICGYYGEKIVLYATELGLQTCWVYSTYKKVKSAMKIAEGEKIHIIISLGYGVNEGVLHKSKEASQISNLDSNSPEWFKNGIQAVLLAPTGMNKQGFYFEHVKDQENTIRAKRGIGPCAYFDLGIAKFHFELGAGQSVTFV